MGSQITTEPAIATAPAFNLPPTASSAGALVNVGQKTTETPPPQAPALPLKKTYKSVSAEIAQEWIDVIFPATGRLVQGVVPAGVAGVCGFALLDPSFFPAVSHDQAVFFLSAALSYLGLGNLGAKK